jgi:uncharacterized membrane protein YdjX (TVP38/TMEM64 family)
MTARYKALLLVVALAALLAAVVALPVREWLAVGIAWIEDHRTISWAAYIGVYVLAAVLVVPGSILTLAAGFVFGLPLGVVLVSAGSVLGAACAFLVGRFLARDWVAERIERLPRFRALDAATRQDGFMIVFLARLSPLFPFNLLNYGLGLTAVRFRDFFLASWIGMLPATVLYVYIGSLAKDLTELTGGAEGGWARRLLLIAGFLATVALTVLITRKATRTLGARLESERGARRQPESEVT